MNAVIPELMQAVQLDTDGGPLAVRRIPVSRPGPGQVLVRMAASPINPSDLGFLAGGRSDERTFPVIPGIEGSGTVVTAGAGWLGKFLVGKRVACARSSTASGAWAEYMMTKASFCVPLRKNISLEQGATLTVNPMTAAAFFDIIKRDRHAAIVNTAAASQLGRMILQLALKMDVPLINIVRRKEQVELLHSMGAGHVLLSTQADFDQKLAALARQLKATLILDAIGGEFTQHLIDAAPEESVILLYANLSKEPARILPRSLWDHNKRIEGFYLATWAAKQNMLKILSTAQAVQKMAGSYLRTEIRQRLPLSAVQRALDLYQKDMTAGKFLLVMDRRIDA